MTEQDSKNRDFFKYLLEATEYDWSDIELSEYLDVSGPTVTRWRSGRNLPYNSMLPGLIAKLKEIVLDDDERT